MDIFQGSFKDGTKGTKDYRYFASLYLIVRVAVYLAFSVFGYSKLSIIPLVVLLLTVLLISYCRPYKAQLYNTVDSIFITLSTAAAVLTFSTWINVYKDGRIVLEPNNIFVYILLLLLLAYLPCLIVYTVYSRSVRLQSFTQQIKTLFSRHSTRPLLQYWRTFTQDTYVHVYTSSLQTTII